VRYFSSFSIANIISGESGVVAGFEPLVPPCVAVHKKLREIPLDVAGDSGIASLVR